jgi:phospholipase C
MYLRTSLVWICAIAAGLILGGCGGGSASLPGALSLRPQSGSGSSPIQHVVLVVQENRSFDNFFALFPGADGAKRGKMKVPQGSGYVVKWTKLEPHSLLMSTDINHCHAAFETAYDGGKMDGFNLVHTGVCGTGKPSGKLVYQYVRESQIQPYWDMAKQYVLGDHMFQTQGSGSFTAHQDLIRGDTVIDSGHSLVDNPTGMPWGCNAPGVVVTYTITIAGDVQKNGPYPCTNKFPSSSSYETLRDLLDAKAVSWKYYSPPFIGCKNCQNQCTKCAGALLNAFDVIYPVWNGPEWTTNVSMPETNIFNDISGGTLPAVSWVIPSDNNSDHPGAKIDHGPQWVASIVNAIGESSYWNSTAIVIVWDDWGGMYDDVAPRQFQNIHGGLGFRVPMIVISPYARLGSSSQGGYISHTHYEFGSILKYVEQNWNLGSLGTTDQRATSIGDVFDYSQQPRAFTPIGSKMSARDFLREPPSELPGDPE